MPARWRALPVRVRRWIVLASLGLLAFAVSLLMGGPGFGLPRFGQLVPGAVVAPQGPAAGSPTPTSSPSTPPGPAWPPYGMGVLGAQTVTFHDPTFGYGVTEPTGWVIRNHSQLLPGRAIAGILALPSPGTLPFPYTAVQAQFWPVLAGEGIDAARERLAQAIHGSRTPDLAMHVSIGGHHAVVESYGESASQVGLELVYELGSIGGRHYVSATEIVLTGADDAHWRPLAEAVAASLTYPARSFHVKWPSLGAP